MKNLLKIDDNCPTCPKKNRRRYPTSPWNEILKNS